MRRERVCDGSGELVFCDGVYDLSHHVLARPYCSIGHGQTNQLCDRPTLES